MMPTTRMMRMQRRAPSPAAARALARCASGEHAPLLLSPPPGARANGLFAAVAAGGAGPAPPAARRLLGLASAQERMGVAGSSPAAAAGLVEQPRAPAPSAVEPVAVKPLAVKPLAVKPLGGLDPELAAVVAGSLAAVEPAAAVQHVAPASAADRASSPVVPPARLAKPGLMPLTANWVPARPPVRRGS